MGVVYRAERLKLGRIVAIKVLHDVLPSELSGRKRFEIEAMAMAKLEHPHCASVVDVGVHFGRPFVVMDFVSGENLKDLIAAGPVPTGRAAEIVRQVLTGLAHAHELGIIHRDIKPANLVLSQKTGLGDHVKILDFGLARLHDAGQNLTAGIVVGTPAYMAPEQIRGTALDARADLYACGVLLFELLTGQKPFHSEADDPMEVCRMHLKAPIPRLDDKRSGTAFGELEAVVAKALAKDRDDRYASAQEFAAALETAAARRPSQRMRPVPPPSASPEASSIELGASDMIPLDASYPPPVEVRTADVLAAVPDPDAEEQAADRPAVRKSAARPAASAPRPRRARGRRLVRIAGVAVGVAIAAGVAALVHDAGSDAGPAAGDSAASSADPGREIAARATELAAHGDAGGALDLLHRARRQYPDSALLAYTNGRICFAKFYWSEGLKSFRDAIRADPSYRADPELIKTVLRGFITTPSYNDDLASFLREDIGGAAQPLLEETARDHPTAAIRSRAAGELRRYPGH